MNTAKEIREVTNAIDVYWDEGFKTLYDLYKRPSYAKMDIYNALSRGSEVKFATCLKGSTSNFSMLRLVEDDVTGELLAIKDTYKNSYIVSVCELPEFQRNLILYN